MTKDELIAQLIEALEPFTGFVDKDGEQIVIKWGASTYTGLVHPEDFARARATYRTARTHATTLGD